LEKETLQNFFKPAKDSYYSL